MALKLCVSQTVQRAKQIVGPSEEDLVESLEAVGAAAEALYAVEADGAEICQVMDNINLTFEALNQSGLTAEFLGTFNSEGETSACCGMENLTVAGLEAMADKQVKELSAKYSAAMEGKVAEAWNKFIAFLKNLWIKVVNWLKTVWQNKAKLFKSLDGVKMMKEFNGDAKVNVVSNGAFNKLWDIQEEIIKGLNKFKQEYTSGADRVSTFDGAIKEFQNKVEAALKDDAKEETLTQRGWNLQKLQAGAAEFKNATAPNGQMAAISKWITDALDQLVKKAGQAGAENDSTKSAALKEACSKQRAALASALAAVRLENSIVLKRFAILHKVMKAAQTAAPKKEEPKK